MFQSCRPWAKEYWRQVASMRLTVRPSRVLTIYYAAAFLLGVLLTFCVALLVANDELGMRGAAVMTLTWNVFFVMILPLVLDWSERSHFKARFLQLEEVAATNPELAAALNEQCEKLAIRRLRLAVIDTPEEEVFSYGLWGDNPRLVISGEFFNSHEKERIVPSIEAELTRFRSQDHSIVFLLFTVFQIVMQQLVISVLHSAA